MRQLDDDLSLDCIKTSPTSKLRKYDAGMVLTCFDNGQVTSASFIPYTQSSLSPHYGDPGITSFSYDGRKKESKKRLSLSDDAQEELEAFVKEEFEARELSLTKPFDFGKIYTAHVDELGLTVHEIMYSDSGAFEPSFAEFGYGAAQALTCIDTGGEMCAINLNQEDPNSLLAPDSFSDQEYREDAWESGHFLRKFRK